MAEKDKKVTFELKDLTYEELLNSYEEVCSFLSFLDESKVAVKGKGLNKDDTPDNLDEIIEDEDSGEEDTNPEVDNTPTPAVVKQTQIASDIPTSLPTKASKEEIDTLFDSNDVDADDDDDDNALPKMKGA